MTSAETKFNAIRARWITAKNDEWRYKETVLLPKYGKMSPPSAWLTRTEENRLAAIDRRQSREMDKMFDLLDAVATRNFRSRVAAWWVMEQLTFADATTLGAMSMTPQPGFGTTTREAEWFAAAPSRVAGSVVV